MFFEIELGRVSQRNVLRCPLVRVVLCPRAWPGSGIALIKATCWEARCASRGQSFGRQLARPAAQKTCSWNSAATLGGPRPH